jgi:hypothetical protein
LNRLRALFSHGALALGQAGLVALIAIVLVAGTALAARGGNGGGGHGGGGNTSGSGTISLALMDGATEAHFAARVTFTISTDATPYPFVHLMCYQGGTLVGEGRQGFFETALGNPWFYLGPTPSWQSGEADCTANLEKSTNKGWSVLASTPSFHVYE